MSRTAGTAILTLVSAALLTASASAKTVTPLQSQATRVSFTVTLRSLDEAMKNWERYMAVLDGLLAASDREVFRNAKAISSVGQTIAQLRSKATRRRSAAIAAYETYLDVAALNIDDPAVQKNSAGLHASFVGLDKAFRALNARSTSAHDRTRVRLNRVLKSRGSGVTAPAQPRLMSPEDLLILTRTQR